MSIIPILPHQNHLDCVFKTIYPTFEYSIHNHCDFYWLKLAFSDQMCLIISLTCRLTHLCDLLDHDLMCPLMCLHLPCLTQGVIMSCPVRPDVCWGPGSIRSCPDPPPTRPCVMCRHPPWCVIMHLPLRTCPDDVICETSR